MIVLNETYKLLPNKTLILKRFNTIITYIKNVVYITGIVKNKKLTYKLCH